MHYIIRWLVRESPAVPTFCTHIFFYLSSRSVDQNSTTWKTKLSCWKWPLLTGPFLKSRKEVLPLWQPRKLWDRLLLKNVGSNLVQRTLRCMACCAFIRSWLSCHDLVE